MQIAIDNKNNYDTLCYIIMRLLNRKVILSSITAVVLVTALVIIKPIPFTKAAVVNTISSNAPGDATTTSAPTSSPQQSLGNPDHVVITSNANPTTTPTDTPIVTPVAVQNQTNASSCHQVCQNVCN